MRTTRSLTLGEVTKFAQEVLDKASELYDVSVGMLHITNNPLKAASAEFSPVENKITLNIAKTRTLRDIVFAIGHEVGHAVQAKRLTPMKLLFLYELSVALLGYKDSSFEVEADEAGFEFESRFRYKNRVFNRACKESVFVYRKQVRNSLS